MKPHMIKTLWISAVVIAALIGTIRFMKKNDFANYGRDHAWSVEEDANSGADRLVRGARINEIRDDVNKLIFALNRSFRDSGPDEAAAELPHLRLQAIDKGVARVEIINSGYLTERMGTSGAQGYLAAATYTLTESPSIKAVEFIFAAGEHAMPGIYSRETFSDFGSRQETGSGPASGETTTGQSSQGMGENDGKDRL
ncbi:MAG: hypothetical protein OEW15_07550 [Nitrospirota bacterium]|nr:hypothetical protein [Nitrospirota bacterium]